MPEPNLGRKCPKAGAGRAYFVLVDANNFEAQ